MKISTLTKIYPMKAKQKNNHLLINPKKESLTPGKLRQLTGLNDLDDEKATEIIYSIRLFAKVLFGVMKGKFGHKSSEQETPVIDLLKDKAA